MASQSSTISTKGVLVVEDNLLNANMLRRFVASLGYPVALAEDGQEALDYLRANPSVTGLILLDLRMPRMDGFQFRAAQRKEAVMAGIPVVIVSAELDTAETDPLEAAAVLSKPVMLKELCGLIRQHFCQ